MVQEGGKPSYGVTIGFFSVVVFAVFLCAFNCLFNLEERRREVRDVRGVYD